MKYLLTALLGTIILRAQPVPVRVSVTIADQGTAPITLLTETKLAATRLLDATVCNESDQDELVDFAMVYQRIDSRSTQALTLYDSVLVARILAVFQDRNVYAKLFKAGAALSSVAAIITAAYKLNPLAGAAMQIAPLIYGAILPVIHSPADIAALSADILPQNAGIKLAAHSCHAGLVVGRTLAAGIRTEVMIVQ